MGKLTRRVLVSYSGGKDSAVTLDLCSRYFNEVYIFRMYYVQGLSFQVTLNKWVKNKYNFDILDLPHFVLSQFLRYGTFRVPDLEVPILAPNDIYEYARQRFNCFWIAGGERAKDSIWRNAMLKKSSSIDTQRGRFYPVMYWSKKEIEEYILRYQIKISPESKVLEHSFRSLEADELNKIKEYYPSDYSKIKAWFPLVEASQKQGKMRQENENKVSEI